MDSTRREESTKQNQVEAVSLVPNLAKNLSSQSQANKKNFNILILAVLGICVFIGILFLILFATVPCQFKSCHANATCINQAFNAKCQCKRGFNGNGYDCDECGIAFYDTGFMPVGNKVIPHQWPASSMFSFFYYSFYTTVDNREILGYDTSSCLALLINRKTILTTANCIVQSFTNTWNNISYPINVTINDFAPSYEAMYNLYLGMDITSYSSNINPNLAPIQQVYIENITVHPKYVANSLEYNVAVFQLRDKIYLDQNVQLACIPDAVDYSNEASYTSTNQAVTSIGFSSLDSSFTKTLAQLDMNILSPSSCSSILANPTLNLTQVICAGNVPNNSVNYECKSDLGGTLYTTTNRNGKNKYLAIGLASDTNQGCTSRTYTNLFAFIDWIASVSYYN